MKLVISCDEVFDVLTRGPFPAGDADDDRVEAHLFACHECRQLSEALRPAVNLFHESIARDEEVTLPTYRGRFNKPIADEAIADRGVVCGRSASSRYGKSRWRLAMGGMIAGVALIAVWFSGVLTGSIVQGGHQSRIALLETPSTTVAPSMFAGSPNLVSLGLPLSCVPGHDRPPGMAHSQNSDSSQLGFTFDQEKFACCTRCHFSGGTTLSTKRGLPVVMSACASCHTRQPVARDAVSRLWRVDGRRAC